MRVQNTRVGVVGQSLDQLSDGGSLDARVLAVPTFFEADLFILLHGQGRGQGGGSRKRGRGGKKEGKAELGSRRNAVVRIDRAKKPDNNSKKKKKDNVKINTSLSFVWFEVIP